MSTMERPLLRGLVATFDALLSAFASAPDQPRAEQIAELQVAWARVVGVLALGAEPDERTCPSCRRTVRRAATRCGYCWRSLPPQSKLAA